MNNGLIWILIISVVLVGMAYYYTQSPPIKNQGELQTEVTLPKYTPSENEQVQDLRNIGTFDPQQPTPPSRAGQMNPIRHNTNVLPFPQISNNYAPQQANLNG